MKHRLLLLTLFLVSLRALWAVDISFGAAISSGFATNNGADLSTGSLVLVGTFNLTPSEIAAAGNNLSLLNSKWTQIGSAFIGDGDPAVAGSNSDPANAGLFIGNAPLINTSASGLNIAGSTLYYWVFNAPTMGAATQHGIFGSTTWTIPSGTGTFSDLALDTDLNYLTAAGPTLAGTALLPVGDFGPGVNATAGGPDFRLANITAIPEPAETAVVAALGALALVFHRRRCLRKKSQVALVLPP